MERKDKFIIIRFTVIEGDRTCSISVTSNPVHIMQSTSSTMTSCGTKLQPWMLYAPIGQRISISLFDFGTKSHDTQVSTSTCRQYGYILDKVNKRNSTICGLENERKKEIYKSSSSSLEIVLSEAAAQSEESLP